MALAFTPKRQMYSHIKYKHVPLVKPSKLLWLTDIFVTPTVPACVGPVKKKVSMTRKYHNLTLQTNQWHREEELHKNHKHQQDQQSKATSSLFPIKMIAKLEKTHSNVQLDIEHKQNPTMGATINNKQHHQNHRLRTDKPFLVFYMEKQYTAAFQNIYR